MISGIVSGLVPIPSRETDPLVDQFTALQENVSATIGIAVMPVGGSGTPVSLGPWRSGPAWSTIKVPLVMAALREEHPPRVTAAMTAAITKSDNRAADMIWTGLGEPPTAARKVESVLAQTGDVTAVKSQRTRPGFSAFGQTDWSLDDQARFLSVAACDPQNKPVFSLMEEIDASQRWGLGAITGSRIKGGWGPSPSGRYLERQIALLTTPTGMAAVAVAAEPRSGSYEDGIAALDAVAGWLADHLAMLPSGNCPD
jgi:hypothetical protein